MPTNDIIAGISISENLATLAVLDYREGGVELLFLDELTRSGNGEFWYADLLDRFMEQSRTKLTQVAVALDAADLTIIQCPLDGMLTQSERNEQVNWELSQYVKDYNPRQYINDVHVLETRSQEGIQNVLVVSVRRDTIFGLQEALTARGLALGVVDVNHFAADSAILRSHPESEKNTCCSISYGPSRIDASVLRNGHRISYRYGVSTSDENVRSIVSALLESHPISALYVHGTHHSREKEKFVKSFTQAPITMLNPFRRILISLEFPSFTRYAASVPRFSAAVGIALRKA